MNFQNFYNLFEAEVWAEFFNTPEKVIKELSYFHESDTILEVGTAEGYIFRTLLEKKAISYAAGYDISQGRLEEAVARTSKSIKDRVLFCIGDGSVLPYASKSFDVVLLPQILEHIPTKKGVRNILEESRRVSRNGLLVSLPLRDCSNFVMRWAKYADPDHVQNLLRNKNGWLYDSSKVEMLFSEIGFEFERSKDFDEFYRLK